MLNSVDTHKTDKNIYNFQKHIYILQNH